ncbi:MAG TPA: tetratricopeptide repeat protein, partial [Anaeromyxobacteraceae bacterium]|nr:tetratricopeptide repeat protein [Anaeromyxobacteraceae bacterium]
SPFVNTYAGQAYFLDGRLEEAMASWQRALEVDPGAWFASLCLARAQVVRGTSQQAVAVLQAALTFNEGEPQLLGGLTHAYARAGRREDALTVLGELKRMDRERGWVPRFAFVWAYVGLGEREEAFAWLEKAYQERRERMVWLNVDPFLEPLRSDPRFHDLARRMGLQSRI